MLPLEETTMPVPDPWSVVMLTTAGSTAASIEGTSLTCDRRAGDGRASWTTVVVSWPAIAVATSAPTPAPARAPTTPATAATATQERRPRPVRSAGGLAAESPAAGSLGAGSLG